MVPLLIVESVDSTQARAARRARRVVVLDAALPLILLSPFMLGHPYGPVMHLDRGSAYYLDLWAVLSIVAGLVLAVPGSLMAYRLRGALGAAGLLLWLLLVLSLAYFGGRWIS